MTLNTLAAWHELVAARNPEALSYLIADDAVFHSPIVHTAQVGKPLTVKYLRAAMQVLAGPTFRYVREVAGPSDAVLEFIAEIDGITVNGVDMIRWNSVGQIVDFKVMIRPLKANDIVHRKMAEVLRGRIEVIEKGSPNAHQRLQEWRRLHPNGYVVNLRGDRDAYIHRSEYCRHLGDPNWEENEGWPGMGNATKVVSESKDELLQWANENRVDLKHCQGCAS